MLSRSLDLELALQVALDDRRCVFEYSSLNHIELDEKHVAIDSYTMAGSGANRASAWDYCHINSIPKLPNGDFLVPFRRIDIIVRISGRDGRILWRLNGKNSDFEMLGTGFRREHMARLVKEDRNYSTIFLFKKDIDGFSARRKIASALVVQIDYSNNVAAEVKQLCVVTGLTKPPKGMGKYGQLLNGNHFESYDTDSAITEHHSND